MFSNDFTVTKTSAAPGWAGEISVVGFIDHLDTITIPVDESWIIQGAVVDGIPVTLDARFTTGTPLEMSHANIVLRYLRFLGRRPPLVWAAVTVTGHFLKFFIFRSPAVSVTGKFRFSSGNFVGSMVDESCVRL